MDLRYLVQFNSVALITIILLFLSSILLFKFASKNYSSNSIFYQIFNSKYLYLTIGLIVIIFSLYPYIIFGDASIIGWYDEADLPIVIQTIQSNNSDSIFSNSFAGGASLADSFSPINSTLNIYSIFYDFFGPMLGSYLFRFIGIYGFFITLFLFSEKVLLNENSRNGTYFLSFISSMIGVFGTSAIYGYTLGGYGWNFFLIMLSVLLIINKKNSLKKSIIFSVLIGFLQSNAFGGIVVFVFILPSVVLLAHLSLGWGLKFSRHVVVNTIIILSSSILFSTPQIMSIYSIMDDSARILRQVGFESLIDSTQPEFSLTNGINNFKQDLRGTVFFGWFQSRSLITFSSYFPSTNFFSIIIITTATYAYFLTKKKSQIKTILFYFILCGLQSLILSQTYFFSSFNWSQVYYFCYPFIGVALAQSLNNIFLTFDNLNEA